VSAAARLIEDGGAAASDPRQFFRSPEFLAAEGVTHTLAVDGEAGLRLPVIVRPIEGSERVDAISPYGYPGAAEVTDPPPDPAEIDWSPTGLVSLFVRDRIGAASLAGGTVRSQVHVADGEGIRKRLREQIRRNERRGWVVRAVSGPEADGASREAFERAYGETMRRTDAAERYLYPSVYFERLLTSETAWLLLAAREASEPEAGAIAALSDGYLHYYLGGTADAALEDSPMKNLFAAMISLAAERELPLNLGGGVRSGDSLDSFKRGFASASEPFRTHEIVCDRAAYAELTGEREAPDGFFPAYRAT
jgi:hypothetical protein